jgi:hypothetical protein
VATSKQTVNPEQKCNYKITTTKWHQIQFQEQPHNLEAKTNNSHEVATAINYGRQPIEDAKPNNSHEVATATSPRPNNFPENQSPLCR